MQLSLIYTQISTSGYSGSVPWLPRSGSGCFHSAHMLSLVPYPLCYWVSVSAGWTLGHPPPLLPPTHTHRPGVTVLGIVCSCENSMVSVHILLGDTAWVPVCTLLSVDTLPYSTTILPSSWHAAQMTNQCCTQQPFYPNMNVVPECQLMSQLGFLHEVAVS